MRVEFSSAHFAVYGKEDTAAAQSWTPPPGVGPRTNEGRGGWHRCGELQLASPYFPKKVTDTAQPLSFPRSWSAFAAAARQQQRANNDPPPTHARNPRYHIYECHDSQTSQPRIRLFFRLGLSSSHLQSGHDRKQTADAVIDHTARPPPPHHRRMKTPKVWRPSRRTVASASKSAFRIWPMMGGRVVRRASRGQRSMATQRKPDPFRRR